MFQSGQRLNIPPNPKFSTNNTTSSVQDMELTRKSSIVDQPKMNYVVSSSDTLEKIAAAHDCTVGQLVKLNKMHSRMVFAGQKIMVPVPIEATTSNEESTVNNSKQLNYNVPAERTIKNNANNSVQPLPTVPPRQATANLPAKDGAHKGPGGAYPIQHSNSASTGVSAVNQSTLVKTQSVPVGEVLKIKVKQVTESDGTITGTLLVTPNCLMFDPEVSHPLVKENGSDLYGMVANMEDIISVTVYKQFGDLTGERRNKKEDIFDPHNITGQTPENTARREAVKRSLDSTPVPVECPPSDIKFIGGAESDNEPTYYGTSAGGLLADDLYERAQSMQQPDSLSLAANASSASLSGSEQQLPCIEEEEKNTPLDPTMPTSS
uniref:LysM domain-containing protein n=1 Tax=Ditylenchus dipsaci TaxID=166011 RepID=A0A915CXQ8_9BILA